MLKLTKTGIGLLTKQYRSVLRKCLLLNLGICLSIMNFQPAIALTETKTVIIGEDASATGDYAVAIGHRAKSKSWSVAIGSDSRIYSSEGIAIGDGATVRGNSSIALGRDSVTTDGYVVSVGHSVGDLLYNDVIATSDYFRRIVNVADGINAHDAVTLGQMNNALNYYYTFRVDEISEAAEFALFLDNEKLSSVFEA